MVFMNCLHTKIVLQRLEISSIILTTFFIHTQTYLLLLHLVTERTVYECVDESDVRTVLPNMENSCSGLTFVYLLNH